MKHRTLLVALLGLAVGAEARDSSAPLRLFDPGAFGLLRTIPPGGDPTGLAFSSDGKRLAVGVGNAIVIYDTDSWCEVRRLGGFPNALVSLGWSPDARRLAAGGQEGAVALWDLSEGGSPRALEGHTAYVGAVVFSPDGRTVLTGSHDGSVRLWDPAEGRERRVLLVQGPAGALSAAFSRDGRRVAVGLGDGDVHVWGTDAWQEERTLGQRGSGNVLSVAFTRDGARVVSATEGSIAVSAVAAKGGESRFEATTSTLGCVALSPDDRYAIVGGGDLAVRIFDLRRGGQEVARLRHHSAALTGVALRPDGRILASIGHDRHLKIWGRVPGGMAQVRLKGFCGIRVQADAQGRVVVSEVIGGTAAQAAGMRAGDVLVSVGGVEIHDTTESIDRIGSYLEGDLVEFGIQRGGESSILRIRLGKRPEDRPN
ncbi:MAG TPA: PDZ domain-containing protein [Planctomycetota bacterium]|nr:PDZ domain-containing protein [Planctomycetota bacterium]